MQLILKVCFAGGGWALFILTQTAQAMDSEQASVARIEQLLAEPLAFVNTQSIRHLWKPVSGDIYSLRWGETLEELTKQKGPLMAYGEDANFDSLRSAVCYCHEAELVSTGLAIGDMPFILCPEDSVHLTCVGLSDLKTLQRYWFFYNAFIAFEIADHGTQIETDLKKKYGPLRLTFDTCGNDYVGVYRPEASFVIVFHLALRSEYRVERVVYIEREFFKIYETQLLQATYKRAQLMKDDLP